ncbi:hypothetical protein [Rhizobium etli]|uniref:Uncharacterized protein n=1 Tax=Rhizobium etli TaxID=29449 RepID=A0A7W6V581_RHIET|nr:hypothetical protein [Rhizobium etli]MBB4477853.1 hypothetical protein [Rhizobium etli]MBB4533685.1 hypothetical protein [Rhizobium etli]
MSRWTPIEQSDGVNNEYDRYFRHDGNQNDAVTSPGLFSRRHRRRCQNGERDRREKTPIKMPVHAAAIYAA